MRDYLLFGVIFSLLPLCIYRPSIGVGVYTWISLMNPHRLTWGSAFDFPFAQYAAIATLIGVVVSSESKKFEVNSTIVIWMVLLAWMGFTTIFAFHPEWAWEEVDRTGKIQLMVFVLMLVMWTEDRIKALVWVVAGSLAFYGLKGGIFGVVTGGQYRVWGPAGSFIEDNNSLGLALIMVLPLLRYLQLQSNSYVVRNLFTGSIILLVVAILSTQSRGAFVGLSAMAVFLWLKSQRKVILGVAIVILGLAAFALMPESWHSRMETIQTYEEDGSAMGRITVWRYTIRVANQRVTGSGFKGIASEYGYPIYAPDIYREIINTHGQFRAVHSIWFGMLGHHGWVGLILYVMLGMSAWRAGSRVMTQTRFHSDLRWCGDLAAMLQVSMIGFAAAGTFLSMEYFDLYYIVLALLVLVSLHVRREMAQPVDQSVRSAPVEPIPRDAIHAASDMARN